MHKNHLDTDPDCTCPDCYDPYGEFTVWCRENGFADAVDGDDLNWLDAAVEAYWRS